MMTITDNKKLRGKLRFDEPMSKHTTWRAGGLAKCYFRPADIEDLVEFLAQTSVDEELVWLGLGSNLLVRDGGISGSVISMQGVNQNLEMNSTNRVLVDAGVTCAKMARFCARNGLLGSEFLAGIPGTVGGALAMNAGAFGGETWDYVVEVETIDRQGNRVKRKPEEYAIAYRSIKAKTQAENHEWFISALFCFGKSTDKTGVIDIKALLDKRGKSQPIGLPSCGSVFTNPEGDHAARLIEASGLKGYCHGKACVSEKHANFIINTGGATASDIESLILEVKRVVKQKQGVELSPEVRIIGQEKEA